MYLIKIKQYNSKDNILVAGYINKSENAKQALIREVKEETNLDVVEYEYNDNEYYERTNTLIHNYGVVVDSEDFTLTSEIDNAKWYLVEEVLDYIKPESLAKHFVEVYLKS